MTAKRILVTAVAGLVLAGALSVGTTAAATTTTVGLEPATQTVDAGDTTTIDIVVTTADDGVGAYNLTVALGNPDVAQLTSVSIPGEPAFDEVTYTDSGDRVQMRVVGLDTQDTGAVSIATLTVQATGETTLSLDVAAVGDEEGNAYTISDTTAGQIDITSASSERPSDGDDTAPPSEETEQSPPQNVSNESAESGQSPDSQRNNTDSPTDTDQPTPDTNESSETDTEAADRPVPGFGRGVAVLAIVSVAIARRYTG